MNHRVFCASLIGTGVVLAFAVTGCGGSSSNNQAPAGALKTVRLSVLGTNYIGAESNLLTGFAVGVGRGTIAPGSRVAVAGSSSGVNAAGQVWYGKSLQTAKNFSLDYNSAISTQSGLKQVLASGNLFLSSTTNPPALAAAYLPGGGLVIDGHWQTVQLAAAPLSSTTAFDVGSQAGGQVVLSGNEVTYTDQNGNVAGQYTFPSSDDVDTHVQQVINADVPPPTINRVIQACQQALPTADNVAGFTLSIVNQSETNTGSQNSVLATLTVTKHTQVNCKTRQTTTFTLLDFSGELDGKGFLAVGATTPIPFPASTDTSPAPPLPPLTSTTTDPGDQNLLAPELLPNGQIPTPAPRVSFDGNYSGTSGLNGAPLALTISGTTVTVTQPATGTGTIDAGGASSFSFYAPPVTVPCKFTGTFRIYSGGQISGGGQSGGCVLGTSSWTVSKQ